SPRRASGRPSLLRARTAPPGSHRRAPAGLPRGARRGPDRTSHRPARDAPRARQTPPRARGSTGERHLAPADVHSPARGSPPGPGPIRQARGTGTPGDPDPHEDSRSPCQPPGPPRSGRPGRPRSRSERRPRGGGPPRTSAARPSARRPPPTAPLPPRLAGESAPFAAGAGGAVLLVPDSPSSLPRAAGRGRGGRYRRGLRYCRRRAPPTGGVVQLGRQAPDEITPVNSAVRDGRVRAVRGNRPTSSPPARVSNPHRRRRTPRSAPLLARTP